MNKTMRRLAILFAAVCVFMIMAVPAFADADPGYYVIGSPVQYNTNDEITVKLAIESRTFAYGDNEVINSIGDVTLTGKTQYYVRDVLETFNTISSTIKAYNRYDEEMVDDDYDDDIVKYFKKGNKAYTPLFFMDIGDGRQPVDGWMYRVNGQYPLLSTTGYYGGPKGALINETPVADGDVITFYFSAPFEINSTDWSTGFVSAETTFNTSTQKYDIQLKTCHENHRSMDPDTLEQWIIGPAQPCTYYTSNSPTGILYDANWNQIATISFSTSDGKGTLATTPAAGTYYLYVPYTQSWIQRTGYTWFTGTNQETCYCLNSTLVFDRIVIQ